MATAAPVFVPTIACVRRSIDQLMAVHANPVTPGYLCVLNAAAKTGRIEKLRPKFRLFFDRHFRAGETPENKPYVVPFGRTETGAALLFNSNVAGSYAPSSMRDVNPLFDVLEIHQGRYTMLDDHAVAVRDRILRRPLPACATACFLYRDFGFNQRPTADDLVEQLNADFGFALGGDILASGVFADDRARVALDDFEPMASQ
jgi:hypothetical protein